jgi:methylmalonyl-CoA mutase C-terminal domain/subunit
MEVVYLGRFGTPEMVVAAALEEGVDVIGLSCHSWEYLYYLDELFELLNTRGLDIPVVVGGSVLSRDDENEIQAKGVAATFGPGADAGEIVLQIRSLAEDRGSA